jgi:hypothetical protein
MFLGSKVRRVRRPDNLTAICAPRAVQLLHWHPYTLISFVNTSDFCGKWGDVTSVCAKNFRARDCVVDVWRQWSVGVFSVAWRDVCWSLQRRADNSRMGKLNAVVSVTILFGLITEFTKSFMWVMVDVMIQAMILRDMITGKECQLRETHSGNASHLYLWPYSSNRDLPWCKYHNKTICPITISP